MLQGLADFITQLALNLAGHWLIPRLTQYRLLRCGTPYQPTSLSKATNANESPDLKRLVATTVR